MTCRLQFYDSCDGHAHREELQWVAYRCFVARLCLGRRYQQRAVPEVSKRCYEQLGFTVFAGDQAQHWLIMKNGQTAIGLFQGMFEKNILTLNPGWDSDAQGLRAFPDVRELQRQLKERGIALMSEADESSTGPASFMLVDPDGNPILFDQHV